MSYCFNSSNRKLMGHTKVKENLRGSKRKKPGATKSCSSVDGDIRWQRETLCCICVTEERLILNLAVIATSKQDNISLRKHSSGFYGCLGNWRGGEEKMMHLSIKKIWQKLNWYRFLPFPFPATSSLSTRFARETVWIQEGWDHLS